jgi:NAD(P)-dependent dehydrogenase (short-subunit alcohol dehydrogenase family)
MIKTTLDTYGKLDILVNNAGKGGPHLGYPFTRTEKIDWDTSYEVNVRGTFYACKAVYNLFIKQGHGKIINMASISGKTGSSVIPHYSAAKAAVINLTQALAREMAPYNINVNAVCPGLIYTDIWAGLGTMIGENFPGLYPNMTSREVFLANIEKNVPMKREQTVDDIANAVMFLCSEAARNITAQALNVCGGAEIK